MCLCNLIVVGITEKDKEAKRIRIDSRLNKKMTRVFANFKNDESSYSKYFKKNSSRLFE